MLYTIFLVFGVFLALALVVLILLHRGRGADVGAAFGGGASGTVFGAKGATSFLGRVISILSVLFFVNILSLTYVANRDFIGDDIVEQVENINTFTEDTNIDTEALVEEEGVGEATVAPEVPN